MAVYFFDSSALVKRYVGETGSGWVSDVLDIARGNMVHAAAIAEVEVVAALARRGKTSTGDPKALSIAISRFRLDFDADILVVEITPALLHDAARLAEKRALRGYDAIQLAAALFVNAEYSASAIALTLVSADAELNAAAMAEGLLVENPNLRP